VRERAGGAMRLINVQWSSVRSGVFSVQVWALACVSYDGVKFHEIKNSEIYLTCKIYERRGEDFSLPRGRHPTIFPSELTITPFANYDTIARERERERECRKGASFHRMKLRGAESRTGGQGR